MRVFFNELSDDWTQASDCQVHMVRLVEEHFASLDTGRVIQGKSSALRNHLTRLAQDDELMRESGFRASPKVKISNTGAPDRATFLVDLQIQCAKTCATSHYLNVELCLNNREAIGTNIIKPEILARSNPEQSHVGLLICPSRSLLLSGNWDASYADETEYLVAYKLVYQPVMSALIGLLQISD